MSDSKPASGKYPRWTSLPVFAIVISLALVSVCIPSVSAQRGHIVLLTVAESEKLGPDQGGTADLYLDIRPGNGQIFIDTFPLTKLDTQSSTRYANQIACNFLGKDCSQFDFFYTIRADSTVVGGPSAGAAIAVLTAAMLSNENIDQSITLTGTINSGGIIGPVAGVKAKALAAKARGLSNVLISAFLYPTELNTTYLSVVNTTNASGSTMEINLSRLYVPANLSNLGISVVEVSTLDEALRIFTNKPKPAVSATGAVTVDPSYNDIMKGISVSLCSRRVTLYESLLSKGLINATDEEQNLTQRRDAAQARGDWYSVASYCFGDLITLRTREFEQLKPYEREAKYNQLRTDMDDFERELTERNLTTLAELETAMIVDERLGDVADTLEGLNASALNATALGFAYERFNSAVVWSAFFRMKSPAITLDEQHLQQACDAKVTVAEERLNYAELYLPEQYLTSARDELNIAREDSGTGRYAYCLFRASKAQALADLFTGSLSIPQDKLAPLVERKLAAVSSVIEAQEQKGYFPIIGYSYYQYASSLAGHDPYSALTFSEYALELSTLDMYFPKEHTYYLPENALYLIILFASAVMLGIVIGVLLTFGLVRRKYAKERAILERKRRSR